MTFDSSDSSFSCLDALEHVKHHLPIFVQGEAKNDFLASHDDGGCLVGEILEDAHLSLHQSKRSDGKRSISLVTSDDVGFKSKFRRDSRKLRAWNDLEV